MTGVVEGIVLQKTDNRWGMAWLRWGGGLWYNGDGFGTLKEIAVFRSETRGKG